MQVMLGLRAQGTLGIIGTGRPLLTSIIVLELVALNCAVLVAASVAARRTVASLRAPIGLLAAPEDVDDRGEETGRVEVEAVVERLAGNAEELQSMDLTDDAELAEYIAQVAADGNLPIVLRASQFKDFESRLYGYLARSLSQAIEGFVATFFQDVNKDNAREEKLIVGHAITFRVLKARAPFRHVPGAGVSREAAAAFAGELLETDLLREIVRKSILPEDVKRGLITNIVFFLSALVSDIFLSMGFEFGGSRFDSQFADLGRKEVDELMPSFRSMLDEACGDIDLGVVERELNELPNEVKLAFAGQKETLRLALLMALLFLYGNFWYVQARLLGRKVQPLLRRPDSVQQVTQAAPPKKDPFRPFNIFETLERFDPGELFGGQGRSGV
jgi:hypothetical protein